MCVAISNLLRVLLIVSRNPAALVCCVLSIYGIIIAPPRDLLIAAYIIAAIALNFIVTCCCVLLIQVLYYLPRRIARYVPWYWCPYPGSRPRGLARLRSIIWNLAVSTRRE